MTQKKGFVKSASTDVPVVRSRGELEKLLVRYGCSRFQVTQDFDARQAAVTFTVPDSLAKGAPPIPVRLVLDARQVYDALFGRPTRWDYEQRKSVYNPKGYDERMLAQAERVAWRQLILWVDAALSAASAGVQRISEAFFAHTLVQGSDGATRRMVDEVDRVAGGSWLALLPPPKGD